MIIPEGYAQANFVFEGLGAPLGAQCTLGVENQALYDPNEMAESLHLLWSGNILGFQSDQVSLVRVDTKFGPNETGPSGVFVDTTTGGDAGDSGSPAVSYLVHKNTPYGGRTGRGRWYIPGAAEARIEPDGAVQTTQVDGLNGGLADFLEGMNTQDLNAVVLHSAGVSESIGPRTITSLTCDARVATQRRRLR